MRKKDSGTSPELIFLVGAGLSVPVGIPAMRGIFESFMDKTKSGVSDTEKKICETFINELGIDEDLEEFLLTANSLIQTESNRLLAFTEKLISPQSSSSRRREFRNKLTAQIRAIKNVRNHILAFSSRTCFRFNRPRAIDLYSGFVEAVVSCGYPIFTTNYDFVLEEIAEEKNMVVRDNFIPKGRRLIWNPTVDFPTGEGLTIIKLHGSVTWYSDKVDGTIEKIDKDTSINPIGHDIERLVIFPTRFKDIYDQHFFALYSHFLSSLACARCLVVIGHSLRDEYLKAGIIERIRKGGFQLIIIDPDFPEDLPEEMQPARVGTAGRITHVPYPFEEFSDELAGILLKSRPSNVATKCSGVVYHQRFKADKIKIKGNIRMLKPNQTRSFRVNIDAYISRKDKPAYVHAWLAARYQLANEEPRDEVSSSFVHTKRIRLAEGLSGFVRRVFPITVAIPDMPSWLQHVNRISLVVGILTEEVKKPSLISEKILLCQDQRELAYSK